MHNEGDRIRPPSSSLPGGDRITHASPATTRLPRAKDFHSSCGKRRPCDLCSPADSGLPTAQTPTSASSSAPTVPPVPRGYARQTRHCSSWVRNSRTRTADSCRAWRQSACARVHPGPPIRTGLRTFDCCDASNARVPSMSPVTTLLLGAEAAAKSSALAIAGWRTADSARLPGCSGS